MTIARHGETHRVSSSHLQKKITYVPQDATLFKGDVRSNLDPFQEHTDVALLDMLRRVHLISSGSATPSAPVSSAASITDPSTSTLGSTSTLAIPEVAKKLEIHLDTLVSEGTPVRLLHVASLALV